jgi:excinuclease ABC subunit B
VRIIRDLRVGKYDILVGINLLREGLDLPEVSLVAILDADKEGFLRSERSLIQTCGRAARNVNGQVILYGDVETGSMSRAKAETDRRRAVQAAYNEEHGITPESIIKSMDSILNSVYDADYVEIPTAAESEPDYIPPELIPDIIKSLKKEMRDAAERLDFEEAAQIRDRIKAISEEELWV